jgi:glucosylceramidase
MKCPSCAFENPDGSIVAVVGNNLPKTRRVTFKLKGEEFTADLRPFSFNTFVV